MSFPHSEISQINKQQGAVLVVCLVMLLVMTILGVSNMQSTTTQLKMSANNQARQVAFQAAETALSKVERSLQLSGHNLAELQSCADNDAGCYDKYCGGGKCFNGSYASGDPKTSCNVTPVLSAGHYWSRSDLSVWSNTSKHQTVKLESSNVPDPKYIVEFLCYIDKNESADCTANPATDCAALFRITTLATSEDEKGRVMLQSTFKIINT